MTQAKVTAHDLVQALKEAELELGHVPSRAEMEKRFRNYKARVEQLFGNHSSAVSAAGLEVNLNGHSKKPKITNEVFEKDIIEHLKQYAEKSSKKLSKPQSQRPHCLFIPDTHFPFEHQPTIQKAIAYAKANRPELIVQLGDLYDFFSASKFPKSANVFKPKDEVSEARKRAEAMWAELKAASPLARCIQLIGNHDVRPLKRTLESVPFLEDWIQDAMTKVMSFDGVETLSDHRDFFEIDENTIAIHGFLSRHGAHRDFALKNVVLGHLHVGSVTFRQVHEETLFELNCGYAADPHAPGLSYTPSKIINWTHGFGVIDSLGPRFIPT